MSFIVFQHAFAEWPVIPVVEIEKVFPGFDRNALTRWQQKGYLQKIRRGYYRLSSLPLKGEEDLFFIANRIYDPSYVSMQSALRWYDFIPEGVFSTTSVTTLKTSEFQTDVGHFAYRNLKPELFWGYRLVKYGAFCIKIADPEKAILDFLYLNPHLDSEDHFHELRLNIPELEKKLDFFVLERYLELFTSKALTGRTQSFIQFVEKYAGLT